MAEAFFARETAKLIENVPDGVKMTILPRDSSAFKIVEHLNSFAVQQFEVLDVIRIENEELAENYEFRKRQIAKTGNNVNEQFMFHSSPVDMKKLAKEGLDGRLSKNGFFGRGIYLTPAMDKANFYSPHRGNPEATRVVYRCKVVLGKTFTYKVGTFDRGLAREPEGHHSVSGCLRSGVEYVIYNNAQVLITEVILYRVPDVKLEQDMLYSIPPPTPGSQLCYITVKLSQFFSAMMQKAAGVSTQVGDYVKSQISELLKRTISPEQFVANIENVFQASSPIGLADRIKNELGQSVIHNQQQASAASAIAQQQQQQSQQISMPDDQQHKKQRTS